MARTFLGIDPAAAIRKLSGDKSADVIPGWDGGGRIQPGNVLAQATALTGSQTTPVTRGSTSTSSKPDWWGTGEMLMAPSSKQDTSTPTPIVDPAAQAAAQRAAEARALADPLYQALRALDVEQENLLRGNRETYDQRIREYDDVIGRDRQAWQENVSTNEGGLQSQRQNKMLSGARLSQGLNSILASMGALNGTGQFLANQAVEGITNRGLGEANETFETNARNINRAWSEAEQEDRNRRERAEKILRDQNALTKRNTLESRQQMLRQLADIYGTDTTEGRNYLSQAGSLYGQIAGTSRPNVAEYQEASSLYSPAALESYLSGIGNTQVTSQGGNNTGGVPINSPLFAGNRRRREEQLT